MSSLQKYFVNDYEYIIVDQFAEPYVYFSYLKNSSNVVRNITFFTKGEDKHLSVACASLISRYIFVKEFDKIKKNIGLVVIDYLQLVTTGNRRIESRQVEVSEISRSLKTMALELDVPVIALAQLSRSAEKRENSQPMLADLRESGSLEQDADMVLFINRKDYYDAKSDKHETIVPAELIIAKHRKGSTGVINLIFELNMSNFKNYMKTNDEE